MSWTDIFPVMDDDMVERYQNEASPQENAHRKFPVVIAEILLPSLFLVLKVLPCLSHD